MKFLLWAAIIAAVLMWLLRTGKAQVKKDPARRAGEARENAEAMLKCGYCGLHIPASEALLDSAGKAFCSEQHRLQKRAG